jgi:pimeloyl-ACP methyl ester carboxylesterase
VQAGIGAFEGGGHGNRFLRLIETEAIPLLEKEYRADPEHRYLLGGSAGGSFALYALFTKPDLFQGIVADSPSIDLLWNVEREFAAAGHTTNARVYLTVAENEWTNYRQRIQMFYRRMATHGYVKGGLEFRRIDRVRHGAGGAESYMQGLLFVAAPIAPEHGVATEFAGNPRGWPHFLAALWPVDGGTGATLTLAQSEAWQAHEAYVRRLVTEKRIEFSFQTPADVPGHDSTMMFFATDRAAADALVRDDPAVKSGMLSYELIEATE